MACAGNWTWDTAPRAGSRVGCWVFLACKHVCHFRGQGLRSRPQPTHDLAMRRALLPGAGSSGAAFSLGVFLPQHLGRKEHCLDVDSGWPPRRGDKRIPGEKRMGVWKGGRGARRSPVQHPIIKRLIKSPGLEVAVGNGSKSGNSVLASGKVGEGLESEVGK